MARTVAETVLIMYVISLVVIEGKGRKMSRFLAGLILGSFLGIMGSAFAAGIFGSGTLEGWTVTKDGEEVCSDPEVDVGNKEIECD
jgi:hypothetical protein